LTSIARSTASRLALTKSIPSIGGQVRELRGEGKFA
jgi:hypothetical protein